MCKYLVNLIGFNADEPEDYYDSNHNSKMKLSSISLSYINIDRLTKIVASMINVVVLFLN